MPTAGLWVQALYNRIRHFDFDHVEGAAQRANGGGATFLSRYADDFNVHEDEAKVGDKE
jgi:hypothetical protein